MIYIIDGAGVLRFGDEEIAVSAGAVIACLSGAGYPHQLVNTESSELRYLVVSIMEFPDLCENPDSRKVGAYGTAAVGAKVGFRGLFATKMSITTKARTAKRSSEL